MNRKNLFLILLIFILNLTLITACWDYTELDEFAIVAGMGIDKKDDKYNLTVEIVNQLGAKENEKAKSEIGDYQGDTLFDAIRNFRQISGKRLYFSHTKVLVISEEIAQEGITPVFDLINRDAEVRSDILLLVSKEETASVILEAKTSIYQGISFKIYDTLKGYESIPKYYPTPLWLFLNDLAADGVSATIPMVSTTMTKGSELTNISGMAVFKKDKMVGSLSGDETTSYLWVKGEVKGGLIIIKQIEDKNIKISLEVKQSNTAQKVRVEGDDVVIDINVDVRVVIAGLSDGVNYIDKNKRPVLIKAAEKQLENKMITIIEKVQKDFGVDIFGFANSVQIQNPKLWKEFKPQWSEIFPKLKTNVTANIKIEGSALTSEPIKVGD